MQPTHFAQALLGIAMAARGSITSMYRTPARNNAVGGHPQSKHMQGLAGDIVLDDPATEQILMSMADRFNLRVVKETDHYHVQVR